MSARLPSWFWLLVCVASFAGSALAWSLERPAKARQVHQPAAPVATSVEPDESTPITPPPAVTEPAPAEVPASAPPQARLAVALPRDTQGGARILRCVVRGRVTYVDAASVCADGSEGKVTVLPR